MSSFHQFLYRICLRSAWPMVMVMLFWTLVVLGPLLGRGLLYLLPLLVAGLGAFFALRALLGEALHSARALPETGELPYGFAGHSIHAFSDPEGQVWLRARDVRRVLGLQRTDAWMAQAYPDGYRRAHPGSAAWFVRPGTVHRHWGGSTWPEVNRFLHFLERELVPLQTRRAASASVTGQSTAGGAPDAAGSKGQGVPGYLARQWRGEQGLLHLALWGAVLAALVSHVLLFDPEPAELTAHYRRYALILLAELLGGTLLSAWWGVGAWRAARRWFGADRSLLAGLVVAMAGMTMLLYAFDHLADRDRQMGLFALAVLAADRDHKPVVGLSGDGRRIELSGEMGFGTTNLVRGLLARHPGIRGIELDSPGGSASEGFALAELVRDRHLDAYVSATCASACVLVFAGGQERLAAPSARFGLHRSGVAWRTGDSGISDTDRRMAAWFAAQGVSAPFIERVMQTPFREMWEPRAGELMGSGLATGEWRGEGG